MFNKSARNFNADMATAGRITIVEAEEIVDEIEPDQIHLPGIYVHRVFQADQPKRIERLTV